jgi:hypothetical protein
MALLPVLLPIFITIVSTRFMLSSHSSHARIRLLEGDKESITNRLITVWTNLEKEVEDAAEAIVEDSVLPAASRGSDTSVVDGDGARSISTRVRNGSSSTIGTLPSSHSRATVKGCQPLLTPLQHRIMANLNTLPNVTKHVAFIHPVRNSHAIIICRNMTMSEHHRGEGVVRAWADAMVL